MFDDWKSILHFFIGFAAGLVSLLHISLPAILTVVFLLYEVYESNTWLELFSDIGEFMLGLAAGSVILRFWIHDSNINI
jgi:hypothetical protein